MAQNTMKLPVELELYTSNLSENASQIQQALSKIDFSLIGTENEQELKQLMSSFDEINKKVKDTDTKKLFNTDMIKMFSQQLNKTGKNMKSLFKDVSDGFKIDVEVNEEELKKAQKEIDKTTKSLSEFQKQYNTLSDKAAQSSKYGVVAKQQAALVTGSSKGATTALGGKENIKALEQAKNLEEATLVIKKRQEEIETRISELKSGKQTKAIQNEIDKLTKYKLAVSSVANAMEQNAKETKKNEPAMAELGNKITELRNKLTEQQIAFDNIARSTDQLGPEYQELQAQLDAVMKAFSAYAYQMDEAAKASQYQDQVQKNTSKSMEELGKKTEKTNNQWGGLIGQFIKTQVIFNGFKKIMNETKKTISELDEAFNGIAIVSGYTTKQVWGMYSAFEGIASVTGFTVREISQLSLEYFRQGKTMSEVIKLTEAAASAAKIAGIAAADSVQYLTSAINGFRMSADQAMEVSDKFAALASSSATDYEGLATALSKVAAQAYTVGVNMDSMMGFIAKALETTQEAPENIGTAFKTIFARMSEIKDYGATLEDGMDLNRVEKALRTVNVQLRNQNGEIRNLDEVLFDVGGQWNNLNKNQKAYVTTALAGTRQQSRLLAVFEDFDRTMDLVNVSANSLGATYAQQATYTESIAFAMNKLTVAWESFIVSLTDSEFIIDILGLITDLVSAMGKIMSNKIFATFGPTIIAISLAVFKATVSFKALKTELVKLEGVTLTGNATMGYWIATLFGVDVATIKTTASTAKATTAMGALKAAMGPVALAIGVATVAAAALFLAFSQAKSGAERLAEATEKLKKTQAELYTINQKQASLDNLIKRYKELQNQTVQTTADLEEMQSILEKIDDLQVGGEKTSFALTGLTPQGMEGLMKEMRGETENKFIEFKNTTKAADADAKTLGKTFKSYAPALQQSVGLLKAFELSGAKSYEEWNKLGDKQKEYISLATQILNLEKKATPYSEGDESAKRNVELYNELDNLKKRLANSEILSDAEVARMNELEIVLSDLLNDPAFLNFKDNINMQEVADSFAQNWEEMGMAAKLQGQSFAEAAASVDQFIKSFPAEQQEWARQVVMGLSDVTAAAVSVNQAMGDMKIGEQWDSEEVGRISKELGKMGIDNKDLIRKIFSAKDFDTAVDGLLKISDSSNDAFKAAKKLVDLKLGDTLGGIQKAVTGFTSVASNIEKLNQAMSPDSFDIDTIIQMTTLYPELWDSVALGGTVSEEVTQKIIQDNQAQVQSAIDKHIAVLQVEREENSQRITALKALAADERMVLALMYSDQLISFGTFNENMLTLYKKYGYDTAEIAKKIGEAKAAGESGDVDAAKKAQEDVLAFQVELGRGTQAGSALEKQAYEAGKKYLLAQASSLEARNNQIDSQIKAWNRLKTQVPNMLKKVGVSIEQYAAQLNELFNIEQRLRQVDFELNMLDTKKATADITELANIYQKQFGLMAEKSDLLNKKVGILTNIRQGILDANKDLAKYFTIDEYGNMILDMEKYNAAAKSNNASIQKQIERLDDVADAYADYTSQIQDTTLAYEEQKLAIKDLYEELTERIKNANRKIISERASMASQIKDIILAQMEAEQNAIEENLEAQKEALEKKYDEELKYLNDRKALYEKFFDEEEYKNELSDLEKQRADIIAQLANLEGAADYNSLKRAEELRKKLQDINKSYTDKVNDYNKEALLDRLDKEIADTEQAKDDELALLDKQTEDLRKEYEERLKDYEALEAKISEVMKMSIDERLEWFKENSLEFRELTKWEKDEMVESWKEQMVALNEAEQEYEDVKELLKEMGLTAEEVTTTMSGKFDILSQAIENYVTKTTKSKSATDLLADSLGKATTAAKKLNDELANAPTTTVSEGKGGGNEKPKFIYATDPRGIEYKSGGTTERTGWHWLDGEDGRPERVLSATQTEAFDRLVDFITANGNNIYNGGGINIGEISISTPQLNSAQDFVTAGKTFAETVKNAIDSRGISINQKR